MRERDRKMVEEKLEQLKPNATMQRAPLTKRQIAVVSLQHACRTCPVFLHLFWGSEHFEKTHATYRHMYSEKLKVVAAQLHDSLTM